MAFEPIENYGVIGSMQSIALVGMNGSIDFMCYPEFDSPTVFAALLDDQKGGRFQIHPRMANMRARQHYLPDTNNLVTCFLAEEGVVEVIDCMPIQADAGHPNQIVRLVKVIRGNVRFEMRCQPRFKYATSGHRLEFSPRCATFFPEENKCVPMSLYSDAPMTRQNGDIVSDFTLGAGQKAAFVLSGLCSDGRHPDPKAAEENLLQTAQVWKSWIGKSKYKGR
jgi:GH15 family glucan-1,4-alpha-glucosidase